MVKMIKSKTIQQTFITHWSKFQCQQLRAQRMSKYFLYYLYEEILSWDLTMNLQTNSKKFSQTFQCIQVGETALVTIYRINISQEKLVLRLTTSFRSIN